MMSKTEMTLLEQLIELAQELRRQTMGGDAEGRPSFGRTQESSEMQGEWPPEFKGPHGYGHGRGRGACNAYVGYPAGAGYGFMGGRSMAPVPPEGSDDSGSWQDWKEMSRGPHMRNMRGPGFCRPPMARERVLRLIREEKGISQRKLAALLSIRPQSLSELLSKLEKDGYITRRQNPDDKREIFVELTETGEQRAQEVETVREQQAVDFFSVLSTEEQEKLSELLDKLLQSRKPKENPGEC